eukprot:TRINITY_DN497_c0_g1_i1.p1 TRINITY_DN497_c0_g1~~TRINITY_DN497_c0_g1_i1.p1  ORF type:complete len:689 (-),score=228.21 TRINITY_DN497_c0_g1_i1:143-2068(-)
MDAEETTDWDAYLRSTDTFKGVNDSTVDQQSTFDDTVEKKEAPTEEGVRQLLNGINQTLSIYGLPGPIMCLPQCTLDDSMRVVDCVSSLLREINLHNASRDEMSDEIQRLRCDLQQVSTNLKKEQERCDAFQNTLAQSKLTETKLTKEKERMERTHKKEIAESQKKINGLLGREAQYQADIRRRDVKLERMQEKLDSISAERAGRSSRAPLPGSSIAMQYPLAGSGRGVLGDGRKRWGGKDGAAEEMLELINSTYEESRRDMIRENTQLRDSLQKLQQSVSEMRLSMGLDSLDGDEMSDESDDDDDADRVDGIRGVPYEMVRDDFEDYVRKRLISLRERRRRMFERDMDLSHVQGEGAVEVFMGKLAEYQELLKEQERVIAESIQHNIMSPPRFAGGYYDEDDEDGSDEKEHYDSKKIEEVGPLTALKSRRRAPLDDDQIEGEGDKEEEEEEAEGGSEDDDDRRKTLDRREEYSREYSFSSPAIIKKRGKGTLAMERDMLLHQAQELEDERRRIADERENLLLEKHKVDIEKNLLSRERNAWRRSRGLPEEEYARVDENDVETMRDDAREEGPSLSSILSSGRSRRSPAPRDSSSRVLEFDPPMDEEKDDLPDETQSRIHHAGPSSGSPLVLPYRHTRTKE